MGDYFRKRMGLGVVMVLFVFLVMCVSIFIITGVGFLLFQTGLLSDIHERTPFVPFVLMLLFSILLGTVLTGVVSKRTLKPLREIIGMTHRVAAGDFTVRIEGRSVPEVEDLISSFNTMVEELASIETLRNDFTSNFSHEFKTPIVSIRGFAKLLKNKDLPEKEKNDYIDIIINESERLAGLATNVLELSRLENTSIVTDKELFPLDEQIRLVAALMEPRWSEKQIDFGLEMEAVTFYGNEDLLHQVWVNLIDNAVKFTGQGGNILINLRKHEDNIVFTITDNGCGMDEHTLAHLFDRFYQGDSSHSGAGNGLGLAMVRQIIHMCGGTVDVENAPGMGSTFTITLPGGEK